MHILNQQSTAQEKEKLKSKKKKDIEIVEALKAKDSVICPKRESHPGVYRVKVVYMSAGITLNKIKLYTTLN